LPEPRTLNPEPSSARRVLYSGRVQGVGFRYTARRIAQGYPISGYVKNLPDGRVELLAEGAPSDLDNLLADIAAAMSDHIHHTETHTLPASGRYTSFEISM
jgi:acylphosphatase